MAKKNNGITLVALTITIIILLTLSGIIISYLNEKNGIIDNAINAKDTTEIGQIKEKVLDKWYEIERNTVKRYYDNEKMAALLEEELKVDDPSTTVEYKDINKIFEINYNKLTLKMSQDGKIIAIDKQSDI